jgi:hypothetical protein
MKTLSPSERMRPGGSVRLWTALIVVLSVGCFPLFSVLADQPKHENKGGSKAPSSHQAAPHGSGVSKAPNSGRSEFHGGGAAKAVSSHQGQFHSASKTVSSNRAVAHRIEPIKTASSHQSAPHGRVSKSVSSHQSVSHHAVASKTVSSRQSVSHERNPTKTASAHQRGSEIRNVSPELRKGASSNSRTSLYARNERGHPNAGPTKAVRTIAYNHSLTRSSAQSLMTRRLTEISNRRWTGHGTVFSSHADPQRGYWYQHGGYWWRCNYWGAHSYCGHLIAVGEPAGLCWAWYDDICWGNIVIGMPLELVTYYYQDPVYTTDTYYDGDAATVYYYATGDGQYKQVTVVDGNVVDVEIVDHIG